MYKVRLFPSKCPSEHSWIHRHKEGEIIEISNNQFNYHELHGCMKVIEKFQIITKKKYKCPTCGSIVIRRVRKKLKS